MQTLLLIAIQAAHLMCVNVAAAGPLVCIWLDWRDASGDSIAGRSGRFLAWTSLVLLVVGALFGVLLGVVLWDDAYLAVLRRLPSRIFFGIWEFLFSLALIGSCCIWWGLSRRRAKWAAVVRGFMNFLAATNLLYHFPFLFAVISGLSSGETMDGELTSAEFRSLMVQPGVVPQVVHVVLASVAMSGVALVAFAWRQIPSDPDAASDSQWIRVGKWGARIALVPTLCQIPVGIWLVSSLPRSAQDQVLGGNMVASGLLLASVLAAFWLMHLLASASIGDARRSTLMQVMAAMTTVIVLMTAVLQRIS